MVNNLSKPESIAAVFRCLDLEGVGYLTKPVVKHHYRVSTKNFLIYLYFFLMY